MKIWQNKKGGKMVDIKNENLPPVQENSEETLKRLEKTKNKIERSSSIIKGISAALPFVAGLAWYGITGNGGMMELSALAAFPVVTAVVAAHAGARDMFEHKIDNLKKKLKGSALMASMLIKQKMRLQKEEKNYDVEEKFKNNEPDNNSFEAAKQDLEKEQKYDAVFSKSAELAKQEGKEKTIGRLMSIVDKRNNKASTYKWEAALQSAYALFVTPGALDMVLYKSNDPFSVACGAAAAVTFSAIAYCAAKTVQAKKRNKNSDRAFNILQKYVNERDAK